MVTVDSGDPGEAPLPLAAKLNAETARVGWAEIERMFAAGRVIRVDGALDLIEVAVVIANDDADSLRSLMQDGQVGLLDDDTALHWSGDAPPALWAVVVKPWVVVQAR